VSVTYKFDLSCFMNAGPDAWVFLLCSSKMFTRNGNLFTLPWSGFEIIELNHPNCALELTERLKERFGLT